MQGKNYLLRRWWSTVTSCPEKLQMFHPWRHSGSGWTGPWATCPTGSSSAHGRGSRNIRSLRSLSTQPILRYQLELCNTYNTKPEARMPSWQKHKAVDLLHPTRPSFTTHRSSPVLLKATLREPVKMVPLSNQGGLKSYGLTANHSRFTCCLKREYSPQAPLMVSVSTFRWFLIWVWLFQDSWDYWENPASILTKVAAP